MNNTPLQKGCKRVAAYLRVSTADQSCETQLQAIQRYCQAQDWNLVQIYRDEGISGSTDQRPGLDQLKLDITTGRYDSVIVWRFDRMARSTAHLLDCLDLFRRYGLDFVSVTEAIDTSSYVGRMVFSFLAAVAQFERELIKERVKAGMDRAKATGKHCGRPRKALNLNEAIRLQQNGLGVRRIAKQLGVGPTTIYRALQGVPKGV